MAEASGTPADSLRPPGLPESVRRTVWRCTLMLIVLQLAAAGAHLYLDSELYGVLIVPALLLPPVLAIAGHRHGRFLLSPSRLATAGLRNRAGLHPGVLLPPLAVAGFGSLLVAGVHLMQDLPLSVLAGDGVRGLAVTAALVLFSYSSWALGYRAGTSGSDAFSALLFPVAVYAVSLLGYGFASAASLPALLNPAVPALLPLTSGAGAGSMAAALEELLSWFHFFDPGRFSILLFLPALAQGGVALILSTDFRSHPDSLQLSDFRLPGALLLGAFLANLYHATLTEGWLPLFDLSPVPLGPYPLSVVVLALLAWTVMLLTASAERTLGSPLPPVLPARMLYPALAGTLFLLPAAVLFETPAEAIALTGGILLAAGALFTWLSRIRTGLLTLLTVAGVAGLGWLVLHGGF